VFEVQYSNAARFFKPEVRGNGFSAGFRALFGGNRLKKSAKPVILYVKFIPMEV